MDVTVTIVTWSKENISDVENFKTTTNKPLPELTELWPQTQKSQYCINICNESFMKETYVVSFLMTVE